MLNGEFKAREARLLADQKGRAEKERARLQKERVLVERSRQREATREQIRLQAIEAQRAEEQAERDLAWQEAEHNPGIYVRVELLALAADESIAITKGIKRSADKVFLPPSVGSYLSAQDASKNGAPLFQLRTPSGSITHAGVMEFTAPEGMILLPIKVARCLFRGGKPSGSVVVKYVQLEKGSFVSFQPLSRGFHEAVDYKVREVLETALSTLCTLSVGDVVEARHKGEIFRLRVQELQPSSAVSVIDTDLEVEVKADASLKTVVV